MENQQPSPGKKPEIKEQSAEASKQSEQEQPIEKSKKKRRGCLITFLIIVIIVVLLIIIGVAITGLSDVPGFTMENYEIHEGYSQFKGTFPAQTRPTSEGWAGLLNL